MPDTTCATFSVSDDSSLAQSDTQSSEQDTGIRDPDPGTSSDQSVNELYNVHDILLASGTKETKAERLNLRTKLQTKEMKLERWVSRAYSKTAKKMLREANTQSLRGKITYNYAVGTGKELPQHGIPDWDDMPWQLFNEFKDNSEQTWVLPKSRAPIVNIEYRLFPPLDRDEKKTLFPPLNGNESHELNTKNVSDDIKCKYTLDEDGASLLWELKESPPQGADTSAIGTAFAFEVWDESGANHQTSSPAETLMEDLVKLLL